MKWIKENKVAAIIILLIIIAIICLFANWFRMGAVLATDGEITITEKDYDTNGITASNILNDLKNASKNETTNKTIAGDFLDFIKKYPQLINYVYKFLNYSNEKKQEVISKGFNLAQTKDTNIRKQIAEQSVTKKEPLWITIIDKTFQEV